MSSAPFMQLYVADYLGDTRHLTTEQHGAYLLLLMAMWRSGGRLRDDAGILSRVAGLSAARWRKINPEILPFFDVEGGHISQKRLSAEIKKAQEKSKKRAEAGSLGGQAKALKDHNMGIANATDLPRHLPDTITRVRKKKESIIQKPPSKGSQIKADWTASEQGVALAIAEGMTEAILAREISKFRDYHLSNGSIKKDWEACWRTWVRNLYWKRGSGNPPAPSKGGGWLEAGEMNVPGLFGGRDEQFDDAQGPHCTNGHYARSGFDDPQASQPRRDHGYTTLDLQPIRSDRR